MRAIKTILAVLAILLAVFGIIACGAGIYYSWALNTPLTESAGQVLTTADSVLTTADSAFGRIDAGVGVARSATSTIEGAVMAAGDTFVNSDIAFTILDRTVGDTLFPVVVEISETARSLALLLAGVNDTLEAANRLPFVAVPTLTTQLDQAAAELDAARQRVDEVRAEVQAMKETAAARPVTAVTHRTGLLLERLDAAQGLLDETQRSVATTQAGVRSLNERLPGLLDWLSLLVTLALLWFIFAQAVVVAWAWPKVRSRA